MNWAKIVAGNSTKEAISRPASETFHLIDIGANLTSRSLKNNTLQILTSSYQKGVKTIILTGTCLGTSRSAIALCRKYNGKVNLPKLYCTVGVHPHSAEKDNSPGLPQILLSLIQQNRDLVVAVGEAGLDYNRNFSSPEIQRKIFELQCQLAIDTNLPLFLHEREAHLDFINILGSYSSVKSVVHCFTGNRQEMIKYLDLGCFIGLTGFITDCKRAASQRTFVHEIPSDRLMIETDAPFMTPRNMPIRVKHNIPEYLTFVAQDVAQLRGTSLETFTKQTYQTTRLFFDLK
jgi:TatD DNase family protein